MHATKGRIYSDSKLFIYGDDGSSDYPFVLTLQGGTDKAAAGPVIQFWAGYAVENWVLAQAWAGSDGYGVNYAGSFNISVNDGSSASAQVTMAKFWHSSSIGYLDIGYNDTITGVLKLHGGATSSTCGGTIFLLNAADYDGTFDYFNIKVIQDDLLIGNESDPDLLMLLAERYLKLGPVSSAPAATVADNAMLWVEDINAAAGKAGFHAMYESGTDKLVIGGVQIKATTGDSANVHEAKFCINTYDNNFKVYADGAWRTLATW